MSKICRCKSATGDVAFNTPLMNPQIGFWETNVFLDVFLQVRGRSMLNCNQSFIFLAGQRINVLVQILFWCNGPMFDV